MRVLQCLLATVLGLLMFVVCVPAQGSRQYAVGGRDCELTGVYRVDPSASDRLYSVVQEAVSRVPANEQKQFFTDLSTRLTPPDLLAIECRGQNVSVGSSRAQKLTFLADGKTRRDRGPGGSFVNSSVRLTGDTLTFTSNGHAEDSVNVSFVSLAGGNRMQVTRRIYAGQLRDTLVLKTMYDKVADAVNWDTYGEPVAARRPTAPLPNPTGERDAEALNRDLDEWISATNERDIERQMSFYVPTLAAYYLTRNTSASFVRQEKNRVFATASVIDIHAAEPEIVFQDNGRTAVMRFRKKYRVTDGGRTKSGEVVQELRWRRTNAGWRIFSERDIRVIR